MVYLTPSPLTVLALAFGSKGTLFLKGEGQAQEAAGSPQGVVLEEEIKVKEEFNNHKFKW
uniref:Uncharacterized protein n=1 Tax=Oryza nivara TaxID=4536 RepID=A0A0E0J4Z7_ORYNI